MPRATPTFNTFFRSVIYNTITQLLRSLTSDPWQQTSVTHTRPCISVQDEAVPWIIQMMSKLRHSSTGTSVYITRITLVWYLHPMWR